MNKSTERLPARTRLHNLLNGLADAASFDSELPPPSNPEKLRAVQAKLVQRVRALRMMPKGTQEMKPKAIETKSKAEKHGRR